MSNPVVIDATPGQAFADISREFEASPAAVFRAHADPELFAVWIGPRGLATNITQWDFRTGGGYRYEQSDTDGSYAFRGVFHTVRENELIIQTFEYEGAPDEISLDVMRFEELPGGRCRIVDHAVFGSIEALEEMVAQGMEFGINEGYEKLDEMLAAGS
ncbi:polyketide cyclase [Microbacterium sp. Root61]|uniref:SRPBCC family protein n=1 Tax=Microbacterium sp. Root61 TaxID=1736570 RepID=UPI0006FA11EC|nr:SRPBCC family protein [Microbacterium sp. Root61]KRA25807.1 polyketide cyclase [Microbacterium sp. Root61]